MPLKRAAIHERPSGPASLGSRTKDTNQAGVALPAASATIQSEQHQADVAQLVEQLIRNQQVVSSSLTVGSIVPVPSPIDELSSISTALVVTPQSSVQGGPPRPQDASLEGPGGAAATFARSSRETHIARGSNGATLGA